MPPIDFPDSPTVSQEHTVGDSTWVWTGTTWDIKPGTAPPGPTGPTGPSGGPSGPTGPTGPTGPAGAGAGVTNYTHSQVTPANIWTVNHGLGFNPNVTVVDSAGSAVVGRVTHIDANNLEITFGDSVFGGKAYLS